MRRRSACASTSSKSTSTSAHFRLFCVKFTFKSGFLTNDRLPHVVVYIECIIALSLVVFRMISTFIARFVDYMSISQRCLAEICALIFCDFWNN